jgi:hypothetical protein
MFKYTALACTILLAGWLGAQGQAAATATSTTASEKIETAAPEAPAVNLPVEEIVQRNVTARGGLQAWRAVQTLSMTGKMEAGGNHRPTIPVPGVRPAQVPDQRLQEQAQLPFVLELKRPHKMRLELQFNGKTAVQVYDGSNGWKLRPFLNRRQIETYTPEELKAASLQADLDGYLIDYAAKGTKIESAGVEKVDGRDAYKLKLTLKSGPVRHVWVDAKTFLESKIEGVPRRLDGKDHQVAIYPRDYHTVSGLSIPYVLETRVEGVKQTEKIRIESVVVGPKLDDSLFAKLQ